MCRFDASLLLPRPFSLPSTSPIYSTRYFDNYEDSKNQFLPISKSLLSDLTTHLIMTIDLTYSS